jgi:sRNA-binding protein
MSELDTAEVIKFLAQSFPQCFAVEASRRRPLKRGIKGDLLDRLGNALNNFELTAALRSYTGSHDYLSGCREETQRYGLDGRVAGVVTAQEAAWAKSRLAQLNATRQASSPSRPAKPLPPANAGPARLSLADLKAAWQARQKGSLADG